MLDPGYRSSGPKEAQSEVSETIAIRCIPAVVCSVRYQCSLRASEGSSRKRGLERPENGREASGGATSAGRRVEATYGIRYRCIPSQPIICRDRHDHSEQVEPLEVFSIGPELQCSLLPSLPFCCSPLAAPSRKSERLARVNLERPLLSPVRHDDPSFAIDLSLGTAWTLYRTPSSVASSTFRFAHHQHTTSISPSRLVSHHLRGPARSTAAVLARQEISETTKGVRRSFSPHPLRTRPTTFYTPFRAGSPIHPTLFPLPSTAIRTTFDHHLHHTPHGPDSPPRHCLPNPGARVSGGPPLAISAVSHPSLKTEPKAVELHPSRPARSRVIRL